MRPDWAEREGGTRGERDRGRGRRREGEERERERERENYAKVHLHASYSLRSGSQSGREANGPLSFECDEGMSGYVLPESDHNQMEELDSDAKSA